MSAHRATGPIPPDVFQDIVNAPYGQAASMIRKYDPLWGRSLGNGEKIKWRVKLTQQVTMAAFVTVEAESEEEAEHLASLIPDQSVSWDFEDADLSEVESAEPLP